MIQTVDQFNYDYFRQLKVISTKKKHAAHKYVNGLLTFDIETTNIDEIAQAVMYIWQCQINEEITVIGRTWQEFIDFYESVNDCLSADAFIICYVHNLSFEFQFLKSVIPVDSVFAMDSRKVLKFDSGNWEFRCSYIHSNMNLAHYLKAMNVKQDFQKKELDYSVKRYPWTELTDEELQYCINDVKGLRIALINEMQKDQDDLYSIPLTSTGYIRRMAKDEIQKSNYPIRDMLPDVEVFDMLRSEFRGGNTHANRWNSNILISMPEHPVYSYDISSSYPSVMLTERFPCAFVEHPVKYFRMALDAGRACLFRIRMYDVELKNPLWGCPYISKAKCEQIDQGDYDNGRVLSAKAIQCVLNEIDFEIIRSEYHFRFEIIKLYTARKTMLPATFRRMLLKLYQDKTALKGIDDYMYGKAKNKFNASFGMMCQNPCRPEISFHDGMLIPDYEINEAELIDKYHREGWLPYQWGCWVTAYARLKLEKGLRAIDPESFIYADTDSIKFIGNQSAAFQRLNEELIDYDLFADDRKGNRHYIGIFECETPEPLKAFKTLGAKKYCYLDDKYNLHLTVSGVSKKAGALELEKIENFNEGFVFQTAGGQEAIYNDFPPMTEYRIHGKSVQITSNIMLIDSTYTLGMTEEYKRLINLLSNINIKTDLYHDYT